MEGFWAVISVAPGDGDGGACTSPFSPGQASPLKPLQHRPELAPLSAVLASALGRWNRFRGGNGLRAWACCRFLHVSLKSAICTSGDPVTSLTCVRNCSINPTLTSLKCPHRRPFKFPLFFDSLKLAQSHSQ